MRLYHQDIWDTILEIININNLATTDECISVEEIKNRICNESFWCGIGERGVPISILQEEQKGKIFNSFVFRDLAEHFFLMEYATKNPQYGCLKNICSNLHAYLGNNYYFKNTSEVITRIWSIGKYIKLSEIYSYKPDNYIKAISLAIDVFDEYNCDFSIKNGRLEIEERELQVIFAKIENVVQRVGGIKLYNYILLTKLLPRYSEELDRYMIHRSSSFERNWVPEPINFMIQICLPYFDKKTYYKYSPKLKQEDIYLFERLCNAYFYSHGSIGSTLRYLGGDLIQLPYYIVAEMITDKFCFPFQYRYRFLFTLMENVIKPSWGDINLSVKYNEFIRFLEFLYNNSNRKVTIRETSKSIKVSQYKVKEIFFYFSCSSSDINFDLDENDNLAYVQNIPIITLSESDYFILDSHIFGMAFYNKLIEALEKTSDDITFSRNVISERLELLVRNELQLKQIQYASGKYKKTKDLNSRECDVVILDDNPVFIELKKRVAIDDFNRVDDVMLWGNLGISHVKAQCQCFFHEAMLYRYKRIVFESGVVLSIEENRLPVKKISVTLGEYSFISSIFFKNDILEIVRLAEVNTINNKVNNNLKSFNSCNPKLNEALTLSGREEEASHCVFHDSIFLSLQQLLCIIWEVSNQQEFIKLLNVLSNVENGTLDVYSKILQFKCLK